MLALFGARFFTAALFVPTSAGDLPWQRWLGQTIRATLRLPRAIGPESFTAAGAPWVPHEWLFSLVASLSSGIGWYLFVSASAVAAVAALAIGVRRAERAAGAAPLAVVTATILGAVTLCQAYGVRVQVIAWPFLAAFLYLIECDSAIAYAAIAVAAAWSNVHASVLLAGPVALAAALGSFIDGGWTTRTKRTLVIGTASLGATCCNPLGGDLPRYAISLVTQPFKAAIGEWQPTVIGHGGALPLLLAIVVFGIGGPHRWRDRCIVVTATLLMFGAVRNVAIFGLVCFPVVARSLAASGTFFARPNVPPQKPADRYAARLFPLLSAVVAIGFALLLIGPSRRAAEAAGADVTGALAAVAALPGTRHVLCADFAWCNALVASARDRVFIDGRADPYPPAVWDDYLAIIFAKPGWHHRLRSSGTDVVVAAASSPFAAVMNLSPDFRCVYANATVRVWALAPSRARDPQAALALRSGER